MNAKIKTGSEPNDGDDDSDDDSDDGKQKNGRGRTRDHGPGRGLHRPPRELSYPLNYSKIQKSEYKRDKQTVDIYPISKQT